jgi:hypothetical protein
MAASFSRDCSRLFATSAADAVICDLTAYPYGGATDAKMPTVVVSPRNNEPGLELFFVNKPVEVSMPILLWLMGVPAIIVIALVLAHVI